MIKVSGDALELVPVTAATSTATQCVWSSVPVLSCPTLTVSVSVQRELLATTAKMVKFCFSTERGEIFFNTVVDCGSLSDPANGLVNVSTTVFNSTATYSCNDGYNLVGDTTRTCLPSGLWSDSSPQCTGVEEK